MILNEIASCAARVQTLCLSANQGCRARDFSGAGAARSWLPWTRTAPLAATSLRFWRITWRKMERKNLIEMDIFYRYTPKLFHIWPNPLPHLLVELGSHKMGRHLNRNISVLIYGTIPLAPAASYLLHTMIMVHISSFTCGARKPQSWSAS
jgi:hypothetical protein